MTIESTLEQIATSLASIDQRLAYFAAVEAGLATHKAGTTSRAAADKAEDRAAENAGAAAGVKAAKDAALKKAADDKAAQEEAARVAAELEAEDAALLAGADDTKVYDYAKDIQPLLGELLKKSKADLVALFAQYGAKSGQTIDAKHYPAIVKQLSAA